jgi:prepilin-type N-terminal cleavage/methylation domain-containing protein
MNWRNKLRNSQCGVRSDSKGESARCHFFRIPRSAFHNSTAFTLIEVMIAITIFSMVLAAIYSTWNLIWRASRVSQAAAAQVQRQRVAIHTIEDALTCIQSFQASMKYYSFVVNDDPPELAFTARLPDNFPRNGKFGDLNVRQLLFTLEAGPDSERDLVLRQRPILLDLDADEQQRPLVLARFVQTFKVECWDTNQAEWVTEWDNTNSIPPLIRVSLVLGGNNNNFGDAAPTLAVSRVIAAPSQTLPAVVQTGGGGPGGINLPGINPPPPPAPGGVPGNPGNPPNIITR